MRSLLLSDLNYSPNLALTLMNACMRRATACERSYTGRIGFEKDEQLILNDIPITYSLYYITPKCVTSLQGLSPHHYAWATQLQTFEEMQQRWQAVGNTVSDLTTRDLNIGLPAPETNALPLNQLASTSTLLNSSNQILLPDCKVGYLSQFYYY